MSAQMQKFKLWASYDFGMFFYAITRPEDTKFSDYAPIGTVEIMIDEDAALEKIKTFNAECVEVKRARLLAELAKLDDKEKAA